MDSDGRARPGATRSSGSSRRVGQRTTDWLASNQSPGNKNYSSSEDENELNEGFHPPNKAGDRVGVSGRAKVTPSDLVADNNKENNDAGGLKSNLSPHQMPHYYQDIPRDEYQHHSPHSNSPAMMNEYESPVLRGISSNNTNPMSMGKRLVAPMHHGSSISSSDNNSDTTYAESDINNSLRTRMGHHGTPPDPAPPEVPPRGPSHHHPLLTSGRRGTGSSNGNPGSPHYHQDQMSEDGYQQPTANVIMSQQEYLMSGCNPRYVGTMGGTKSPVAVFRPSPTRDFMTNDFSQNLRIMNTIGSEKDFAALNSSGTPGSPSAVNSIMMGTRASFGTSIKPHLDPSWKEKLSWKCVAIILLLVLCAILTALLTFFAASYATLDGRTKGCVVVEDAAKVIAAETQSDTTTGYPTPAYTIPVDLNPPQQMQPKGGTELTHLQVLNRKYSSTISPQGYWNIQYIVKQPMFIRFHLIVPRNSQLAFYGRRNVAPSITQYDFVEFLNGRTTRSKRSLWKSSTIDDILSSDQSLNSKWVEEWLETLDESEEDDGNRSKRYLNEREVNVSLVEYLDTGIWYLSIYNDGLAVNDVSLLVQEDPELQSACVNHCSGKGSCVLGHCECVQGWVGDDCSKSVCPVLCSGHGNYGGGICHCDNGWKGQECDIPVSDCVFAECFGHGTCIGGTCNCYSGWKGENCQDVACRDPNCGSNGWCVDGVCICKAGWRGTNCTELDEKVFTCLPDCSGNGQYDLHESACVCDPFWSGPDCSIARCSLDCVHGVCDGNVCSCDEGWTGVRCHQRDCDARCHLHGKCNNGTCLCSQGWNGRHCTIAGCKNRCSGNGVCSTEKGEYKCSCSKGWMGADCSVRLETACNDDKDNDGDGLIDCNDSECCSMEVCRDHVMCMVSSDPVEVLLRKQPPAVTASFYQRVKFIIEDKNVQSFARIEEFDESRVSVIRGQVVTPEGQGIVGVRTSIEKKSKYGLTATRKGGWFDVMVNGGGAITLQFQRAHFEPLTVTVPVLWNQIIVLDPIVMRLKNNEPVNSYEDPDEIWKAPCTKHQHGIIKPQIVTTFFPEAIGGSPDSSVVFTENQVVQESLLIPGSDLHLIYQTSSVAGYKSSLLINLTPDKIPDTLFMVHLKITLEGNIYEKLFEADPNINFTFIWNKRNIYKQKVYGETLAAVSVGYEYLECNKIVWETQTARLFGFRMDISDVGGWNLENHHMYNFESGLLQRGDGSTLNMREAPPLVSVLMGTGTRRTLNCKMCSGAAKDAELLAPGALAAGPDGSIYVGDFNLIRKVSPDGLVSTVLQLGSSQMSHRYYMSVSPSDGHLYVSDPEKYRILRLLSIDRVSDPLNNYEVVAGNGERCIPGDELQCGDNGPALKSRLAHPKGIAIATDGTIYIADGTNVRMVDNEGIMHTLIGHHSHKTQWKHLPCHGGTPAGQLELQWPTGLLLSPLDNSLHILDDQVVLQVTNDGSVRVRAGTPIHCKKGNKDLIKGSITNFVFSPSGSLFVTEQTSNKLNFIREITSASKFKPFAGASLEDCRCAVLEECTCPKNSIMLASNVLFGPLSAITASPDGTIHIADQKALKIYSFQHYLPEDDENGDFHVAFPKANELYLFNRHGHHLETKDLTTGKNIYKFGYSKNTSFGRLSKVTDSSGNKMLFLRNYKAAVNQIENTAGEKFKVEISRLGLMTQFSERLDRQFSYEYDDDTGLLLASSSPGDFTILYKYDDVGRLIQKTSPIGFPIQYSSQLKTINQSDKIFSVQIKQNGRSKRSSEDDYAVISMLDDQEFSFTQGLAVGSIKVFKNNSWIQNYPWEGISSSVATSADNPLLESYVPTQASLNPIPSQYTFQVSKESQPNVLFTSFGVVADSRLPETLVEKVVLVNGSRVLSHKWVGVEKMDSISNRKKDPLLKIYYNDIGQPMQIVLGDSFTEVTMSYDRYGRIEKRKWNSEEEIYSYNTLGLMSHIQKNSGKSTEYHFMEGRQLETITLPSGRTWTYNYDGQGGLKFITTPSGSTHKFSLQPSFGFYIYTYMPPGTTHGFRQHLDHEGKIIMTAFPGGSSKVVYRYNQAGMREEIISGDGKTSFKYGSDGLPSEINHEESDFEYQLDYSFNGLQLQELRMDFNARTALSNSKFTYQYDSNFRTISLEGRIGGQNLKEFNIAYDSDSGAIKKIEKFKISRPSYNETVIHDGTAIFSRKTNQQFKTTQLSVTIHKMEVFRMDIAYNANGKISQTDSYTRNVAAKPYTNSKNYTYDSDGQLIGVNSKEPWNFSYDDFGNMLSLTYSTNKIPMKYDSRDRIIKFGEGGYKYDLRGAIVQNAKDVNYQYDARGRLTRAFKPGRFAIKYMYDHDGRLIARKDNFGNVTQFLYGNQECPDLVTHIYNPRNRNLISMIYDDRGHIIFAQIYRNKYYIATDECGTPVMVFNKFGEVVREIMRSPYGHIIYDSNPYLYLPIDFCGGILEAKTELVHMRGGKVYNPLIGLNMVPSWEDIPNHLVNPSHLSLYRFNGNDPMNIERNSQHWRNNDVNAWLKHLNFHLSSVAPQLYSSKISNNAHNLDLWTSFTKVPLNNLKSPFYNQIKLTKDTTGLYSNQVTSLRHISKLATQTPSTLSQDFWPDSHQVSITSLAAPFGPGITASVVNEGRVIVEATAEAHPIFKDVLPSVFNNSVMIDAFLMSHNSYVFYFVKDDFWKATDDMTQLNRLAGAVNISYHEPPAGNDRTDQVVDIKLQSTFGIIHIRYGSSAAQERKKLYKHAKKSTVRLAWSNEKDLLSQGLVGSINWSEKEKLELLRNGSVSRYSIRYINSVESNPELIDDPSNLKFYKNNRRTRRTLRARKSRRCRKKWWHLDCQI